VSGDLQAGAAVAGDDDEAVVLGALSSERKASYTTSPMRCLVSSVTASGTST